MYEGSGGEPESAAGTNGAPSHPSFGGTEQGGSAGQEKGGSAGKGGASVGGDSSGGQGPRAPTMSLEGAPIYTRVQRLTRSQWENAVRDILRLESPPALGAPEPSEGEPPADFSNNERLLYVDIAAATALEEAAEAAAERATASEEELARVHPTTDPDEFVRSVGRRAFRRPLTDAEEARYQAIFARGEELYGPGFVNGAALVLRAMLQSPSFVYRSELGDAGEPLTGYEIASKLSFWLLDTTPSDALLDLAASGALDTPDGLEEVARGMLEDAAANAVLRNFHRQLYELDSYADREKEGVESWSPALRAELTDAAYAFFDAVFERGEGLMSILTSTRGFVGPNLAPFYGMDAVMGLEEQELGQDRIGHFLQVPFLMHWGDDEAPASSLRGYALSTQVLCAGIPPHPLDSPPLPVPPDDGSTNRYRVEGITAGCGGTCHSTYIDPLGFAFEGYDGMGRARELDNGQPVDSSGTYPLAEQVVSFSNARELLEALANSTEAHLCYAKKLASFALQRDVVVADLPLLETLATVSRSNSIRDGVVALVRDPAFRLREGSSP